MTNNPTLEENLKENRKRTRTILFYVFLLVITSAEATKTILCNLDNECYFEASFITFVSSSVIAVAIGIAVLKISDLAEEFEQRERKLEEFEKYAKAQQNEPEVISKHLTQITEHLKEIDKKSLCINTTCVELLPTREIFYQKLMHAGENSKSCVYNMHIDIYVPSKDVYVQSENDNNIPYLEKNLKKAESNEARGMEFKRIVNISSMDMLNWVEELVRRVQNLENYQIAYINIDLMHISSQNSFVNCQVIDDNIVFLLDPDKKYVPYSQNMNGLYLKGNKINEYYKNYYDRLWDNLISSGCSYGCLIKGQRSDLLFDKNRERIITDIKKGEETQNKREVNEKERGLIESA